MENKKFRPWPRPGLGVSTGTKIEKWLIAAGVLLALVIIASTALVMRHDGLIMKAVNTVVRRPLSSDRSTLLEIAAGWILVAAINRGRAVTGSASVTISINSRYLDLIASIAGYRGG